MQDTSNAIAKKLPQSVPKGAVWDTFLVQTFHYTPKALIRWNLGLSQAKPRLARMRGTKNLKNIVKQHMILDNLCFELNYFFSSP